MDRTTAAHDRPARIPVGRTSGIDWPNGIDYERWAPIVRPAPREAFADPLDLLDMLDKGT
jgi:hypothetical protein